MYLGGQLSLICGYYDVIYHREVAGHASEAYSAAWDTNWTKAYDRFV